MEGYEYIIKLPPTNIHKTWRHFKTSRIDFNQFKWITIQNLFHRRLNYLLYLQTLRSYLKHVQKKYPNENSEWTTLYSEIIDTRFMWQIRLRYWYDRQHTTTWLLFNARNYWKYQNRLVSWHLIPTNISDKELNTYI